MLAIIIIIIIIIEEGLIAGCFINGVLKSLRDRTEVQKGNKRSKLHEKLNVHIYCYLTAQTPSQ